jgi:diguanylate cyclase (GGDEF)-like protein
MRKPSHLISIPSFHLLVWLWPLLAALAIAALWTGAVNGAAGERTRAEAAALKETGSHAQAYERYVTRSIGQIDQVTMQLKQSWEQSRDPHLLEDLRRKGMFTDSAFVAVGVVDREGTLRSSTGYLAGARQLADSMFFEFHRNNISSALRIDVAPGSRTSRQDAVLFTRRLDTADDSFDGAILILVDARYFTAFFSRTTLGSDGMVAMVGADSALRLEQHGSAADAGHDSLLLAGAGVWQADAGVRLVGGRDGFTDGADRFLGWRRSASYPLVTLVALSRREAMAAADQYWRENRNDAIAASVLLALVAALASAVSWRAAQQAREQDEVQRAYRAATENANDGFYMVAPLHDRGGNIVDFEIVDCNERGAFFYGMSRRALLGSRLSRLGNALFGEDIVATYKAAMASGFHEDDRHMPLDNRANFAWGHRRVVRVGNSLAVTLQDISERKAHDAELQRLANEDTLTGLPNRYWFMNFMPEALQRSRAAHGELALLFIDLDEFKHVNDTYGHAVGDQLLSAAAQRMRSLLRPTDHVVRFGGDEFIVMLAPAESRERVAAVAQRVVTAMAAPFALAGEVQVVGASVGISVFPRDGEDAATLVKHSDIAMYAAKSEGRGQYRFFEPALSMSLQKRTGLRNSLQDAIERDQLTLYYQPRVDTWTGTLCSMEALLRWQHPVHGMIAPSEFIPIAEDSGLILRIGEIVIDKACAQLAEWRAQGVPLVPVSINVSARQFARGNVHQHLARALQRYQLDPALLEVEITESAMMGEQDEILAELDAIRALGIKLHVDDFGTGYSSLSQLQRLKMDVLKVDRAFTAELGNSREGKVFFQAIVSMAHALGMAVVAEGVETEEQLRILQTLQCNEVQGFYIARPMPAPEMGTLMERGYLFRPKTLSVVPAPGSHHVVPGPSTHHVVPAHAGTPFISMPTARKN